MSPSMTNATRLPGQVVGRFCAEVAVFLVPEDAWHGDRAKAVVKVLALAPDHCHREQVMDALWPEMAPEIAERTC
jgi:DNA-binding SARP family transcriptional activator